MKKLAGFLVVVLALSSFLVYAHGEEGLEEAKRLIGSKASCPELSDEQLEDIGDYYMEQMHPGEAHELMDKMMGGEGSEGLKQMHIMMARQIYCGENTMQGGMMNNMGGFMGAGQQANMMGGMMGGYGGYGYSNYWNFMNVLYIILLVGLIILVYLWIAKLWRNGGRRQK